MDCRQIQNLASKSVWHTCMRATDSVHAWQVLIVHGEDDPLIPASNSRRLAKLLPTAELCPMPRTGHVPHEERPSDFMAIVRPFLEQA